MPDVNAHTNHQLRQLEQANGFFGAEVGKIPDWTASIESGAFDFISADVTAEIAEVEN